MATARIAIRRDGLRLLRAYYELPEKERAAFLKDLERAAARYRSMNYPHFRAFMVQVIQGSHDSLPRGPAD